MGILGSAPDIHEPGQERSQNKNWAKPYQPARCAWTHIDEGDWTARGPYQPMPPVAVGENQRPLLGQDQSLGEGSEGKKHKRDSVCWGTQQQPRAACCHLAYEWQKAEEAVERGSEEFFWYPPTGRYGALLSWGPVQQERIIPFCKENESVWYLPHTLPAFYHSPLCHPRFLGQKHKPFHLK